MVMAVAVVVVVVAVAIEVAAALQRCRGTWRESAPGVTREIYIIPAAGGVVVLFCGVLVLSCLVVVAIVAFAL